jgi:hypothetical protein
MALAGATLLWQPTIQAAPYIYTFEPGTTTVLGGNTEAVSGSFSFDTNTNTDLAVSISLAGASPYAGLYTTSLTQPANSFTITAQDQMTLNRLELFFLYPLQYSPDPLALAFFQSPREFMMGSGEIDNRPVGTAVSPTAPVPVPEPPSFAIIAVLSGLLIAVGTGLGRWRTAEPELHASPSKSQPTAFRPPACHQSSQGR